MIRGMMLFAMMLTLLGCRQAENVVSGTVTIDG